ncbi:MAG: hypothetical protein LBD68_01570 [Zoogloeaceae bacterium]|jgi:hypothetical protein|nr:hypothetical protein [Zoogloeaceae bacterium]
MDTNHLKREIGVEAEGAAGARVSSNAAVLEKLQALYWEAFAHDGFAGIQVEIRILRRGQKEVILHCGKQYRFVVDYPSEAGGGGGGRRAGRLPEKRSGANGANGANGGAASVKSVE